MTRSIGNIPANEVNPTGVQGTLAARPAAGLAGRLYYATDTTQFFYDIGGTWLEVQFASGPITRPVVATLPGAPFTDGREVLFQTAGMKTTGVPPYLLRFRSGSPVTTMGWEAMGAPYAGASPNDTGFSTSNSTYSTDNVIVTSVPAAGEYFIQFGAYMEAGTSQTTYISPGGAGLAASDTISASVSAAKGSVGRRIRATLTAGNLTLHIRFVSNSGGVGVALDRFVHIQPIRLTH